MTDMPWNIPLQRGLILLFVLALDYLPQFRHGAARTLASVVPFDWLARLSMFSFNWWRAFHLILIGVVLYSSFSDATSYLFSPVLVVAMVENVAYLSVLWRKMREGPAVE